MTDPVASSDLKPTVSLVILGRSGWRRRRHKRLVTKTSYSNVLSTANGPDPTPVVPAIGSSMMMISACVNRG